MIERITYLLELFGTRIVLFQRIHETEPQTIETRPDTPGNITELRQQVNDIFKESESSKRIAV